MNRPSCLYRHFDEMGVLLYVGISVSAFSRLSQHKSSSWSGDIRNVTIENFKTRDEAMMAERIAIKAENPKYNISHAPIKRVVPVSQWPMDLKTYTQQNGQAGLAESMKCSVSLISQMVSGKVLVTDRRAIAIEEATGGAVGRWELRPDLWAAPVKRKRHNGHRK